jgi:hypothetical protein
MKKTTVYLSFGILAALFGQLTLANDVFVYPAQGQSQEQQDKDQYECYNWAKQNTGIDPAAINQAPPPAAQPSGPAVGGGERVRGALRGAAAGAIIGEIADDDAGKGAGIGATAGVVAGGARARQNQQAQQQSQQQQAQAQTQNEKDTYNRAYSACLEGRGYSIK